MLHSSYLVKYWIYRTILYQIYILTTTILVCIHLTLFYPVMTYHSELANPEKESSITIPILFRPSLQHILLHFCRPSVPRFPHSEHVGQIGANLVDVGGNALQAPNCLPVGMNILYSLSLSPGYSSRC